MCRCPTQPHCFRLRKQRVRLGSMGKFLMLPGKSRRHRKKRAASCCRDGSIWVRRGLFAARSVGGAAGLGFVPAGSKEGAGGGHRCFFPPFVVSSSWAVG